MPIRLFIIFFVMLMHTAGAQELEPLVELGDKAFASHEYVVAAGYYEQVLKDFPTMAQVRFKFAECHRFLKSWQIASSSYKEVYRMDEENYPMARYWYAELMKRKGEYSKAAAGFRSFVRINRSNSGLTHFLMIANHEAELCSQLHESSSKNKPNAQAYSFPFNTPYSEFNPVVLNDSSLIYSIVVPDSFLSNRNHFYVLRRFPGDMNHVDTILYDKQSYYSFTAGFQPNDVFFSMCPQDASSEPCKLYYGIIDASGLKATVLLTDSINPAGYDYKHPMFVQDDSQRSLYVASNRPGGYGGYDIWKSNLNGLTIVSSDNLGSTVNSPLDEFTPYYHRADSLLFFSSEWFSSYGGFDIFKSPYRKGAFLAPENLGFGLNSSYDELYFSLSSQEELAYFTSNKPQPKMDFPACCSDLYSASSEFSLSNEIINRRELRARNQQIDQITSELESFPSIHLYFDNDFPNPQSRDSVTRDDFLSLYSAYAQQEVNYRKQYASAYPEAEKSLAEARISYFFEKELRQGFNQLNPFLDKLSHLLELGCQIEIEIESYASPLNSGEYNLLLSKRRIHSLMNYFDLVFSGSLEQALANGRLVIHNQAMGDSKADAQVSADLSNLAQSVYSPEAAHERRISIVAVKVNRIFDPSNSSLND